ncbi:MAG: universal stress protein [Desulfovibrio sp.]|nr:universal stress protein [Desulfovibrio sp.]
MTFETILCSVDLGEGTADVCQYAADLARALSAKSLILYVGTTLSAVQSKTDEGNLMLKPDGSVTMQDGTSPIASLATQYFSDMPTESRVILGNNPAESIARFAQDQHCSMIVTGTPRTGLSAMMRPSVGRMIQKYSGLPVTMVGKAPKNSNVASPIGGLAW